MLEGDLEKCKNDTIKIERVSFPLDDYSKINAKAF